MGLGADDVLSVPFDRHELLSRVRSQLRNRHLAHEIRERLRTAEENRNGTQQVVAHDETKKKWNALPHRPAIRKSFNSCRGAKT